MMRPSIEKEIGKLEIKTADELVDPELEKRWKARRTTRETEILRCVLRSFAAEPGIVLIETIAALLPGQPAGAVQESLARLDTDDLIQFDGERVAIAYPFSAAPTPFTVRLAGGQERFACCAIDALGVAPMLGQRVQVRSRCHRSGVPLEFPVTADGPGPEAVGVMVWVGKCREGDRRAIASF
jgi:hypothetical protein